MWYLVVSIPDLCTLTYFKDLFIDEMVGADALAVVRPTVVYLLDSFCSSIQFYLLLSPYLCFISFLYRDLYVFGDDSLIS